MGTSAIILAAGKGTRMKSDLPKVVHPVGGRAMVCAVVDACLETGCDRVVVVVGYQQEKVRAALEPYGSRIEYAVQSEQLGTGHAVMQASPLFGAERGNAGNLVYVLAGDGPLIRSGTLRTMREAHERSGAAATIATSVIEDPTGYGRIWRDGQGRFLGIVEHKNCTAEQRGIREVYPSYACFDVRELFELLPQVPKNPTGGEYYLTDVFGLMLSRGRRVEVVAAVSAEDVLSINTPEELAKVDAIYRSRRGSPSGVGGVGAR